MWSFEWSAEEISVEDLVVCLSSVSELGREGGREGGREREREGERKGERVTERDN